jgi:hypothetical protein
LREGEREIWRGLKLFLALEQPLHSIWFLSSPLDYISLH